MCLMLVFSVDSEVSLKVTQSGWLLWLKKQMENRNGLIGPLISPSSSHLFVRAFLLLHLIASEITESHFVPFASGCDHFCSLAEAIEKGSRQPIWRSSLCSCSSGGLKCKGFTAFQDLIMFCEQHKSTEPSNINL